MSRFLSLLLLSCTGTPAAPDSAKDADSGDTDSNTDSGADSGPIDSGAIDTGPIDTGPIDTGTADPDRTDDDGDGFSEDDGDCDDTDDRVFPGAEQSGNGRDDDCDGEVDEGTDEADDDGDGFSEAAGDCDDADPLRSPAAIEVCDGAIDEDCDGNVDERDDVLGSDPGCAARSCLEILSWRPTAPDGDYWIDVAGVTHEVVCDMTRDTGGWTLVANFVWPGNTGGVAGWTSGYGVGTSTTDRTQSFKLDDAEINDLVTVRYRARGTASYCTLEDRSTGACTVDTTLYWASSCVYESGSASSGDCTAAYQTYDLDGWTELSNPCSWHYGLTSADCGVTSEFGTSHHGEHVFAGLVGTYIHAYDGRSSEDPSVEVWVR